MTPIFLPHTALDAIDENAAAPAGQTVASFTGSSITDVDSGALAGIAVIGSSAPAGSWQYSLDGGATWQAVGSVSEGNALLLRDADVLMYNLRPQAMRRLGLDPATLRGRYPRLIQCGCYGYGDAGPYAGRPAIDDTIQAASGLAWLQGRTGNGEPGYVNTVAADKVVGLYAANAITAALYARERTGEGQAIEVPMFECMVAFTVAEHLSGRTFVPPLGEAGYDRLLNEHRRPFPTSDGHISVVPYTDAQWRRFFALSGHPEMAEDPRYRSAGDRSRHFPELYRFVGAVIRRDSTEVWVRRLADSDIPFATVNSIDALLADPHLQAVGFWREVDHPTEGSIRQAGFPVGFSATPAEVRRHAPALGEHTDEVLGRPDTEDPPGI